MVVQTTGSSGNNESEHFRAGHLHCFLHYAQHSNQIYKYDFPRTFVRRCPLDDFSNQEIRAAHSSSLNSIPLRPWVSTTIYPIEIQADIFTDASQMSNYHESGSKSACARYHDYAISTNHSLSRWRSLGCCYLEKRCISYKVQVYTHFFSLQPSSASSVSATPHHVSSEEINIVSSSK